MRRVLGAAEGRVPPPRHWRDSRASVQGLREMHAHRGLSLIRKCPPPRTLHETDACGHAVVLGNGLEPRNAEHRTDLVFDLMAA